MAPRYIALAAGAAICLQGCFDLKEHTKGFIEFTCGIQVTKLVDGIEEKLNDELVKRCEQLKESFEESQDFIDISKDCVNQGASDIEEGVKATETNYTAQCIERLNNGTDDIMAIKDAIQELVNSWTPDLGAIHAHLNSTLNNLQEEAQKKIDEAKESVQEQVDNAHETVSDHLSTDKETRLYSASRLPRAGMNSAVSVACVAAAALVAMAGLLVFQRRHMIRNTGAVYMEQVEEELIDGELGQ